MYKPKIAELREKYTILQLNLEMLMAIPISAIDKLLSCSHSYLSKYIRNFKNNPALGESGLTIKGIRLARG